MNFGKLLLLNKLLLGFCFYGFFWVWFVFPPGAPIRSSSEDRKSHPGLIESHPFSLNVSSQVIVDLFRGVFLTGVMALTGLPGAGRQETTGEINGVRSIPTV